MGAPIRLEAVFTWEAAFHLRETPLRLDQTIMDRDEEGAMVQAAVHDSSELRWWLLGFGVQVEMMAPVPLRREMQQERHQLLDRMEERTTRILERMDQQADDRHREVIEAIRTLRA